MNDIGALQVRHESKHVLEEDDYLAALGAIIERDFFPQTQGLRDQLSALETQEDLNSGEPVRIALAFARIRGTKQVRVNRETQYLTLTGIVRPRDILLNNTVQSNLIAEARIEFTGAGVLADKQGPGWGTRAADALWPF